MSDKPIANHVRIHRKRSGLTQTELAQLVGYRTAGRVSRHEHGVTPSLPVALGYEAVFRVPLVDLFPAIHQAVTKKIDARLAHLECALGQKSEKDRDANATARKLEFIWGRKNALEV